jgi:hypothetical protein
MLYSLFLSDYDYPPEDSTDNWIICRHYDEAVEIVKRVSPDSIYFGESLKSIADCLDFANWLIRHDETEDILYGKFTYDVDPDGDFAKDIERVMTNYLRKKFS